MLSPADEALLNDLLDGRLAPADEARARARLAAEPALAAAFDRLQHLRDLLQDNSGAEPPARLLARVREALAAEPAGAAAPAAAPSARPGSLPPAWRRVVVAAYALAAMLVVAVGAIALQHSRREDAPTVLDARSRWAREVPSAAPQDESDGGPAQAPALQDEAGERKDLAAGEGSPRAVAPPAGAGAPARSLSVPQDATSRAAAAPAAAVPAAAAPAAAAPPPPARPAATAAGTQAAESAAAPAEAAVADDNEWSPPPGAVARAKAEALEAARDLQRAAAGAPAAPSAEMGADKAKGAGRDAGKGAEKDALPAEADAKERARLADR
ncbi:MAG: hypothetical protein ACKOSS_08795 [Planctomycetia bacterium]